MRLEVRLDCLALDWRSVRQRRFTSSFRWVSPGWNRPTLSLIAFNQTVLSLPPMPLPPSHEVASAKGPLTLMSETQNDETLQCAPQMGGRTVGQGNSEIQRTGWAQ